MRLLVLVLLLQGCTVIRGDYCDIYHPVYTHQTDTELTKGQVDKNNAAWVVLCDE